MNIEDYWDRPPPEPTAKCVAWRKKIEDGWRPNRRISQMGYYEKAEFFGVYIWEYINVISPMLNGTFDLPPMGQR